jgi:hypothetical protein
MTRCDVFGIILGGGGGGAGRHACIVLTAADQRIKYTTIIEFLNIIHRPVFYLKHTTFRRLDSFSVFRWNLLGWAQSIKLVPISGHLHQHKIQGKHNTNHLRELFNICRNSRRYTMLCFVYISCLVASLRNLVFVNKIQDDGQCPEAQ